MSRGAATSPGAGAATSRGAGTSPASGTATSPGAGPGAGTMGPAVADGARALPDVRIGGRRILLTPHNCFACGELNVHGLHLDLHAREGRCWSELELPERFEGWEGIAHGGIVCTILDEVMAWAIVGQDAWGVTARMTVEFRRPVRVGTKIRGEGWIVRARRRVFDTAARIVEVETGAELATAEATYVAAPEERKRALKERYAYRLVPDGTEETGAPAAAVTAPEAELPGMVDGS